LQSYTTSSALTAACVCVADAAFNTPRHWEFVESFPQTAFGKKLVLRESPYLPITVRFRMIPRRLSEPRLSILERCAAQ